MRTLSKKGTCNKHTSQEYSLICVRRPLKSVGGSVIWGHCMLSYIQVSDITCIYSIYMHIHTHTLHVNNIQIHNAYMYMYINMYISTLYNNMYIHEHVHSNNTMTCKHMYYYYYNICHHRVACAVSEWHRNSLLCTLQVPILYSRAHKQLLRFLLSVGQ